MNDLPTGEEAQAILGAIVDAWNDANVTMDEARDWYDLPQIRQIQVVERMLSVVGLMVALTKESDDAG